MSMLFALNKWDHPKGKHVYFFHKKACHRLLNIILYMCIILVLVLSYFVFKMKANDYEVFINIIFSFLIGYILSYMFYYMTIAVMKWNMDNQALFLVSYLFASICSYNDKIEKYEKSVNVNDKDCVDMINLNIKYMKEDLIKNIQMAYGYTSQVSINLSGVLVHIENIINGISVLKYIPKNINTTEEDIWYIANPLYSVRAKLTEAQNYLMSIETIFVEGKQMIDIMDSHLKMNCANPLQDSLNKK